jgi:hypothetical protein
MFINPSHLVHTYASFLNVYVDVGVFRMEIVILVEVKFNSCIIIPHYSNIFSLHMHTFIISTLILVSHIDTFVCDNVNFKELHQGYLNVVKLLGVFNNFRLE